MPRNQNAGNLALRNRNRVTNKTRLKVIKGNIDADPIVLDEDEERARVVSTAGVDAEDANEHHLQAVLSAASHRATTLAQKSSRSATDKAEKKQESSNAFIPVPDAAGVVDNYVELYPTDKWTEPATYVKFSSTVDECIITALVDGFTYVMDERDEEWLDKNNQEARGEGTSAQASSSGTTTRSGGHRSAKSRGKEVETHGAVPISENEFELAMGIFEKLTHDNTPYLHVSFQQLQGACVPPFSDYQDVFANDLSPSLFATYMRPPNLPPPPTLHRVARAVYPHWRERKIERECLRIIPSLNFNEDDAKNESYICFRRRDIKAIRKTRTAQVSSLEKLLRLKAELSSAQELGRSTFARETQKREAQVEAKSVWEKRMTFVDMKRRFPTLITRDEEELLFDKERVPKKPKPADLSASHLVRLKNRPSGDANSTSPAPAEPQMRPREKFGLIQNAVEDLLRRQKDRDHHWDDQIDNPYQQLPTPYSERLFKVIRSEDAIPTSTSLADIRKRNPQHLRLRVGRGGRMHLDRRLPNIRLKLGGKEILRYDSGRPTGSKSTQDASALEQDRLTRLAERWRFDSDTPGGSADVGNEEEDRVLYDDFDPKLIRYSLPLMQDLEHSMLVTDPRLHIFDPQTGTYNYVNPSRVISTPQHARRESVTFQRPMPQPMQGVTAQVPSQQSQPPTVSQLSTNVPPSATPIAIQTPVKKMAPPDGLQQIRVPSSAPQRSPSSASQHSAHSAGGPSSSPTNATAHPQTNIPHGNGLSAFPGVNGVVPNISAAGQSTGASMSPVVSHAIPNGQGSNVDAMISNRMSTPSRPQSTVQAHTNMQQQLHVPNTFPSNGMGNGMNAAIANNLANGLNGLVNGSNGFSNSIPNSYASLTQAQQLLQAQKLQKAYAGIAAAQNGLANLQANSGAAGRPAQSYQHLQNATNGVNVGNGVNGMNGMNVANNMNGINSFNVNGVNGLNGMNGMNGVHGINSTNVNNAALLGPVNMNLKLPAQRQIQWTSSAQRPQSAMNGHDVSHSSGMHNMQMAALNGLMHPSMPNGHTSPARSAHSPHNSLAMHAQDKTSSSHQLLPHSPHMGSPAQSHLSPPRNMQTPIPHSPSPLLQHQLIGSMPQQQGF